MWKTRVQSLGWEDPLEKEMSTHSSILAWRIPWTEEPGGLQSTGLQRGGLDWATKFTYNTLGFMEDSFPRIRREGQRMVWGCFQRISYTVHFGSIIITSALPHITSYQIPEVEDICFRVLDWNQLQPTCTCFFFYFICLFIYIFNYTSAGRITCWKTQGLCLNPGLWHTRPC